MKILEYLKIKLRGSINISKLKKDGCIIGKNFHAMDGTIVDPGHCWLIKIGDNVTLAPNVHILAHDASTKIFLGYTKIAKVNIGNNVFIGAGTIILPGVTIGNNVVVGAGSVVTSSLESNNVYFGSPAKKYCSIDKWINHHKEKMKESKIYDTSYIINKITLAKKEEMKKDLEISNGYIK